MANPIKPTPLIKGRDAERFMKEMRLSQTKKVSQTELVRIKENFSKLNNIASFH